MNSRLWEKLRNKAYRKHFVEAQVKRQIPFQMRALLKKARWTQGELAERAELTQGAVSRALNPNYGNLTLNTIIHIASGFDVAFIGRFVPFSKLVEEFDEVTEELLYSLPSFTEEDALVTEAATAARTFAQEGHKPARVLSFVKKQRDASVGGDAGASKLQRLNDIPLRQAKADLKLPQPPAGTVTKTEADTAASGLGQAVGY